jgi:hypothetical protein
MTFPFWQASHTDSLFQLLHKQQLILAKDLMNYECGRVAKTAMPPGRGIDGSTMGFLMGKLVL